MSVILLQKIVSVFALIFVTFEVQNSNWIARISYFFFKGIIIIAVVSYLASTEPSLR